MSIKRIPGRTPGAPAPARKHSRNTEIDAMHEEIRRGVANRPSESLEEHLPRFAAQRRKLHVLGGTGAQTPPGSDAGRQPDDRPRGRMPRRRR
jgi:hypothetical protein